MILELLLKPPQRSGLISTLVTADRYDMNANDKVHLLDLLILL